MTVSYRKYTYGLAAFTAGLLLVVTAQLHAQASPDVIAINVQGAQASYVSGDTLAISMAGELTDGTPALRDAGWHVQYHTYYGRPGDELNPRVVTGYNGNTTYADGRWTAQYAVPGEPGTYFIEMTLYCSYPAGACGTYNKYASDKVQIVYQVGCPAGQSCTGSSPASLQYVDSQVSPGSTVRVGQTLTFHVFLKNPTASPINNVSVYIIDQRGWGTSATANIAAGEEKDVTISLGVGDVQTQVNPHVFIIQVNNVEKERREIRVEPATASASCTTLKTMEQCTDNSLCYWDGQTNRCVVEPAYCVDTDGGKTEYSAGITYGFEDSEDRSRDGHADYCGTSGNEAGKLKEYFCSDSYKLDFTLVNCPAGCQDGKCKPVYVGYPDLVIRNAAFSVQSSSLATIEFDIANIGENDAHDWFPVAVYVDGKIITNTLYNEQRDGTTYGEDYNAVVWLKAGQSFHKSLSNYSWLNDGRRHTVKIVADTLDRTAPYNPLYTNYISNMIAESDEGNNAATLIVMPGEQTSSVSSVSSSVSSSQSSVTPRAGYENEVHIVPVRNEINPSRNWFTDTTSTSDTGRAANVLTDQGVIGGYPDHTFRTDQPVNRAEAAKFLMLAVKGSVEDIHNSGKFADVLEGEWYVKYVMKASQLGVIAGYPDGTFRPADTVNTAEFLKMLSLAFGLPLNLPHSYVDVAENTWFSPYAGIAASYELFPDRGATLQPARLLTRGEVALAIYQILTRR